MTTTDATIEWPAKYDVLGVGVSATTYEQATDLIVQSAKTQQSSVTSLHAVHAIVTTCLEPDLKREVSNFDIVAPDGQPVRWALNLLYGVDLPDRVYGPELTLRLCERASREGVSIYLYGSTPDVLEELETNLCNRYPGLRIAGSESPPFRALTAEESEEVVQRINNSGAGIVFVGLGCPKQDYFAARYRDRIHAALVCVGAAFDFHAGTKRIAPSWMQNRGLEWLFRLCEEPKRLWRRYLFTNSIFVQRLFRQWLYKKRQRLDDATEPTHLPMDNIAEAPVAKPEPATAMAD